MNRREILIVSLSAVGLMFFVLHPLSGVFFPNTNPLYFESSASTFARKLQVIGIIPFEAILAFLIFSSRKIIRKSIFALGLTTTLSFFLMIFFYIILIVARM